MGLFGFLAGKSPEDMELAGDRFYKTGEFGAAKLEYEKALARTGAKFPEKTELLRRLADKIKDSRESLAGVHLEAAREWIAAEHYREAEDLLRLALELSENPNLRNQATGLLASVTGEGALEDPAGNRLFLEEEDPFADGDDLDEADDEIDEYFTVLCHSLPDDLADAYQNYDQSFKEGFVALNNGDFETAVEKLSAAVDRPGVDQPLAALELATAYTHLGKFGQARDLILAFVDAHGLGVRPVQMLCDVYWGMGAFRQAMDLLDLCPEPLRESFSLQMLRGETCYQMGDFPGARTVFEQCRQRFGENERITRSLAKTLEAMGSLEAARDLYGGLISGCARRGTRVDPFLQRRYAELCFACGERSQRLVDLYFSIVQADPDNKADYYRRIHALYTDLGKPREAARYAEFAP